MFLRLCPPLIAFARPALTGLEDWNTKRSGNSFRNLGMKSNVVMLY